MTKISKTVKDMSTVLFEHSL